jgi:hypothetical protein
MGTKVTGADAAKLFDPIADIHVGSGSPGWVSRWPTRC